MQNDFFTWYSGMEFSGDTNVRLKRWNSLVAVAKAPSPETLEVLTRLAFRTKLPPFLTEAARLREQLADGAPPLGDEELALLAASTLSVILNRLDATSARATALVTGASCAGLRAVTQPMNLVGMAKNAQGHMSETFRRRPPLEQQKLVNPQIDIQASLDGLQEGSVITVSAAINALATATTKALTAMATRQRQFESAVQDYVRVQDEELDILWWLQGGRCTIFDMPFEDVPVEHRPLVFACELANLTKVQPGPTALQSLFSRTGVGHSTQTTIASAIQGLPKEWLEHLLPDEKVGMVSIVTTPVLEAVRRRKEVDGQDTWIAAWSSVCGINQDALLPTLQFSEAVYRELLQVRLG